MPSRDAATAAEALQVADQRMYGHKASRAAGRASESRDVLMRVLAEREPDLHEHITSVAELAGAVGRRLGLAPEGIDELVRAAELHDVGKMAIPDTILNKPGPLDDDEWAFMRRHTLIGEAILSRRARARAGGEDRALEPRALRRRAATRTGWPATRSPSPPASWPSATPSTR